MTTGSIIVGAVGSGPFYYQKSWNGADGKYSDAAKTVLKENSYSLNCHKRMSTLGLMGLRYPNMTQLSPPWHANKTVELQSKLVQQARAHSFNMGVAAAEGAKTASMVVSTLRSIGRAVISLKHGDIAGAARHLGTTKATHPKKAPKSLESKDIANKWLELQYGWLPLLSDVHEAASAFADKADKARSHTIKACVMSKTRSSSYLKGNYMTTADATRSLAYKVTLKETMDQARSLGLLSPMTIAWEIVPYSFVVDWFCPVGSYLDNLSNIPSLIGTSVTTAKTEYSSTTECLGIYSGSHTDYTGITLTRTVGSGISVAKPSFNAGSLADSGKRVWNAIALCAQKFL